MYLWHDDESQDDLVDELPRTVPGYAPERLGRPVEPRSEGYEERLYRRICAAMRDGAGEWGLPFGIGLTWALLDAGGPPPGRDGEDGHGIYAIRMMTVHAVGVADEDEPWRPSGFEIRRESLWLMRHHLEAIERQKPRLYGGSAFVLLSDPPMGASDHWPMQAVEITVAHAPPGGRPEGDPEAHWHSTHLLRAQDLGQPLVLAMGSRPPALPG